VYDKDTFSKSDFLGEVKLTGEQLLAGFDQTFPLKEKEGGDKKHNVKGDIHLKVEFHKM